MAANVELSVVIPSKDAGKQITDLLESLQPPARQEPDAGRHPQIQELSAADPALVDVRAHQARLRDDRAAAGDLRRHHQVTLRPGPQ